MVGDAASRYVDAHPSLCETHVNDTNDNETVTNQLDITKCPKALEVIFTITFATGLIMVRIYRSKLCGGMPSKNTFVVKIMARKMFELSFLTISSCLICIL